MRPVWGQASPRSDVSSVPALSCILECRAPPGICPASSLPYRCTGSETWEGNNGNARRLMAWGIACRGHALFFKWWARASRADPLYVLGIFPGRTKNNSSFYQVHYLLQEAYIILSESWLARGVEGKCPLNRSYRQKILPAQPVKLCGQSCGGTYPGFRRCRERTMSWGVVQEAAQSPLGSPSPLCI